ncbi:MAG: class I SAM-dependent methyltransferase [Pseudomonadota bacterium]
MSGFDPTWLALREAYDHAVRDVGLTKAFVKALGPEPRLIDLGCGTGSNLRYLAPHLPKTQRWLCIDYDPILLEQLEATKPAGIEVETRCLDLAASLDDVPIEPGVGVTAAALLDLASAAWLERLAEHCREAVMLMTVSFDGRIIWGPENPADASVTDAFCRHQRSDKGFGPALGPNAAEHIATYLQRHGHQVRLAPSDWIFGAEDRRILDAMIDGIAGAAGEIDPYLSLETWRAQRLGQAKTSELSLTIGHLDLLALPA